MIDATNIASAYMRAAFTTALKKSVEGDMVRLIKGFKVFMLLEEGYAAGLQPQEVGWQTDQDPDIRDGFLMIKDGLKTHGVPLRIIHGFSIEPVYVE